MLDLLRTVPGWVSALALIALSVLCAFAPNFPVATGIALGALAIGWICARLYLAWAHPSPEGGRDAQLRVHSIKCPRCGWSGPVKRAHTEVVDGRKEVSCPRCDRRLEAGQ